MTYYEVVPLKATCKCIRCDALPSIVPSMRVMGEMKERYGRDKNDLSRAQSPFYKGDFSDDGRDGGNVIVFKKKK